MSAATAADVRVVVLTQEHRGHGVGTALFYLGQALVRQGVRVLIADLSLRRSLLGALFEHSPMKNLGLWTPGALPPEQLSSVLGRARQEVAGRADCILVDVDALLLEHAGGMRVGIDYLILAIDNTTEARQGATKLAERLGALDPGGRAAVLFARVPAQEDQNLETRLEGGLPVLGSLPADYLLATADDYTVRGAPPPSPHEAYVSAINRIATTLIRLAPLRRGSGRSA
ncbi:MAG TPA: hypothetical protein VH599_13670 [Ktedonobacterales bacterium]|jgi:hypothetical protein